MQGDTAPTYNYVEGEYEAHQLGLFGVYRKLLNNTFYLKGRVGLSYYRMEGELKSTTQNTANTTTSTVTNADGSFSTVTNTIYDSETTRFEGEKIKDDEIGIAGGIGIGARLTRSSNLELTYEANPLFDGVQLTAMFRF